MRELIVQFVQDIQSHFNGMTVGSGGNFGATLTNGPFDITTYFHQWQEISNPSIHVQVVQEVPTHTGWFECCGGPTNLLLNVRISVDQKEHGWSIAMALYEELRTWLCEKNYSLAPAGEDYLVIVSQQVTANHVYEGDVFSIHTSVTLTYMRGYES